MKNLGILVSLVAAVGCKSATPAPSTTRPSAASGDASGAGAPALALCAKFKADLSPLGDVQILDRTAKPAYAEAGVWCRATVKTAGGLTCHLAALETPATAVAMAADIGGGAWPVQQTDGKVTYAKEGGTAFLWCGDAVVTPEVQAAGRAVVDAS